MTHTTTKKQKQTFYTFSPVGLSKTQIKFLIECERLFFAGANISTNTLKEAFTNAGYAKGSPEAKECLEAWHYWESMKFAADRSSYKNPLPLSDILTITEKKHGNSFYVTDRRSEDFKSSYALPNMEYFNSDRFRLQLMYDFTPNDFYFTITKHNALFLEYQHIIGNRLIAFIQ